MAMDKKFTVTDAINIALAMLAWLFPDVPLQVKAAISFFLITILAISYKSIKFPVRSWPTLYYVLALILSQLVSLMDYYLSSQVFPVYWNYAYSIVFGLLVGLPLMIYAMKLGADMAIAKKAGRYVDPVAQPIAHGMVMGTLTLVIPILWICFSVLTAGLLGSVQQLVDSDLFYYLGPAMAYFMYSDSFAQVWIVAMMLNLPFYFLGYHL